MHGFKRKKEKLLHTHVIDQKTKLKNLESTYNVKFRDGLQDRQADHSQGSLSPLLSIAYFQNFETHSDSEPHLTNFCNKCQNTKTTKFLVIFKKGWPAETNNFKTMKYDK